MFNNHKYRASGIQHLVSSIEHLESSIEHRESSIVHRETSIEHRESVLIPLQLSRELYKSNLFMQNKPNLQNDEINVTSLLTKGYENLRTFCRSKNKAKQTQNKPNFSSKLALFFPIKAKSNPTCSELVEPISPKWKMSVRQFDGTGGKIVPAVFL